MNGLGMPLLASRGRSKIKVTCSYFKTVSVPSPSGPACPQLRGLLLGARDRIQNGPQRTPHVVGDDVLALVVRVHAVALIQLAMSRDVGEQERDQRHPLRLRDFGEHAMEV